MGSQEVQFGIIDPIVNYSVYKGSLPCLKMLR